MRIRTLGDRNFNNSLSQYSDIIDKLSLDDISDDAMHHKTNFYIPFKTQQVEYTYPSDSDYFYDNRFIYFSIGKISPIKFLREKIKRKVLYNHIEAVIKRRRL